MPWCFNALKTVRVIHEPLWRDEEVRCVHYILDDKPWHGKETTKDYGEVHGWWWDRFGKLGEEMELTDKEGWLVVCQFVGKG